MAFLIHQMHCPLAGRNQRNSRTLQPPPLTPHRATTQSPPSEPRREPRLNLRHSMRAFLTSKALGSAPAPSAGAKEQRSAKKWREYVARVDADGRMGQCEYACACVAARAEKGSVGTSRGKVANPRCGAFLP